MLFVGERRVHLVEARALVTYQFVGDLRLFEEPVLLVGQRRVRFVEARALVPQSAQQVFLLQQRVDLTQRVQRLL